MATSPVSNAWTMRFVNAAAPTPCCFHAQRSSGMRIGSRRPTRPRPLSASIGPPHSTIHSTTGRAIPCSPSPSKRPSGPGRAETRNVELFAEAVRQKERLGIPLIGECYVVEHAEKTPDQVHEKVRRVSRVMAELGADLIKTFFTGPRFHEVVENTPVPVFTIGAEKLATDLDALQKAAQSIRAGARGVIFGRNIFLSPHPDRLIEALNAVINGGVAPEEAARAAGLN